MKNKYRPAKNTIYDGILTANPYNPNDHSIFRADTYLSEANYFRGAFIDWKLRAKLDGRKWKISARLRRDD